MTIDVKYKEILLEALEDKMYKVSLQLNDLKGSAMTEERSRLTRLQRRIEQLQHLISQADS